MYHTQIKLCDCGDPAIVGVRKSDPLMPGITGIFGRLSALADDDDGKFKAMCFDCWQEWEYSFGRKYSAVVAL